MANECVANPPKANPYSTSSGVAKPVDGAQRTDSVVDGVSLLHYIRQHWQSMLAHTPLAVTLQSAVYPAGLHCEIFVGDEFLQADQRYVDVVIKPCFTVLADKRLPAVLVFEKQSGRLVQHELNGLSLETRVLANTAKECHVSAKNTGADVVSCLSKQSGRHRRPPAWIAAIY